MKAFAKDFGPFNGKAWINASSIGPLPRVAFKAAQRMIGMSRTPYQLSDELFHDVPLKLKMALGQLIGAPDKEIILGNSASYGLHLWANGIPLQKDDEVLLVKGDFPASILPWLNLRKHGITVREIKPRGIGLDEHDVVTSITPKTKILCATWVDSFTGYRLNARAIGQICQEKNVMFLLNVTQGLGAESFDVSQLSIDGITCTGYKWLCGPYATGFCWMKLDHIKTLDYNQAYWITMQGDKDLEKIREYQLLTDIGATKYDVFATANLFNFVPWTESINYLNRNGIPAIKEHNDLLVNQFLQGLDKTKYEILSPRDVHQRTAIIIISHIQSKRNKAIFKLLQEKSVFISFREGLLRFSPHLYNTPTDIEKALNILNSYH